MEFKTESSRILGKRWQPMCLWVLNLSSFSKYHGQWMALGRWKFCTPLAWDDLLPRFSWGKAHPLSCDQTTTTNCNLHVCVQSLQDFTVGLYWFGHTCICMWISYTHISIIIYPTQLPTSFQKTANTQGPLLPLVKHLLSLVFWGQVSYPCSRKSTNGVHRALGRRIQVHPSRGDQWSPHGWAGVTMWRHFSRFLESETRPVGLFFVGKCFDSTFKI